MNENTTENQNEHCGGKSELIGLVMPESWAKTVADAQEHLHGDCPLAEDEDIVRADKVIAELMRILHWNISVFRTSDDWYDPSSKTLETLKRDLKDAGILVEA